MSKIEDLLNRTVRDETNVTKGSLSLSFKIYIVIICSVIISVICCFSLLPVLYYVADVNGYLQDNKQIINLYDFYDQKLGENESAVFFIGSSIVGYSIYTPEINRILKDNYFNITSYNLVVHSDIPIERALDIQKIIDAKPSLVIFGITYRSVTDEIDLSRFFDRTKLVYSRLDIRGDCVWLYTEDEKKYFSPLNDLERKKYLHSAINYKLSGYRSYGSLDYIVDPYGYEERMKMQLSPIDKKKIIALANDPNNVWRPIVTNESTRYKDALIYNVKTLQDAGIPIIILNMPLHPLYSEKITHESRANFYDLLNETGAVWYDLERDYGDDFFIDDRHATFDGALKFAPRMADLIIEQVEKDVIHYT